MRILVIPHTASRKVRIRAGEIARYLSRSFDVFYLDWNVPHGDGVIEKISTFLKNLCEKVTLEKNGSLQLLKVPVLTRPLTLARSLNRLTVESIVKRFSIDVILNSSTHTFSFPVSDRVEKIYDFADYEDLDYRDYYSRFMRNHMIGEARRASRVFAASGEIAKILKLNYGIDATPLPNGVDISRLRSLNSDILAATRKALGLEEKYIIGYVSFFREWSNLDFAIKVFRKFHETSRDARLLVIGPGSEAEKQRKLNRDDHRILFTGELDENSLDRHIAIIDMGILTSDLGGFRRYCSPLKVMEYTAFGKPVVTVPIPELVKMKLPNVRFAFTNNERIWLEAMNRARATGWKPEWDFIRNKLDWSQTLLPLLNFLEDIRSRKLRTSYRSDRVKE